MFVFFKPLRYVMAMIWIREVLQKQVPTRHWPIAQQILNNSVCDIRQSWDSHDTVIRKSWDSHETVMKQSWYSLETVYYSTPVAGFADVSVLVCSVRWSVSEWRCNRVATWPWPSAYGEGHGKNKFSLTEGWILSWVASAYLPFKETISRISWSTRTF